MRSKRKTLVCPRCGSPQVVTEQHERFFVNTNQHYDYCLRNYEFDSPALCLDCEWIGERQYLTLKDK